MKHLILFNYFETELSKKNLLFFIQNGLILNNPDYHFCFIIKGNLCTIDFPKSSNIQVLSDENKGFDFSAFGLALKHYKLDTFDRFIFLNCSSRGPFLPRYLPKQLLWPDIFTSHLDEKIKLAGPTINYCIDETPDWIPKGRKLSPHIQSNAFCTDRIGLKLLMSKGIFDKSHTEDKMDIILDREIRASQEILAAGYKLFAFQYSEHLNNPDLKNIPPSKRPHDDIHYNGAYYNTTLNPIEIMFIKPNRINTQTLSNYSAWKNKQESEVINQKRFLQNIKELLKL